MKKANHNHRTEKFSTVEKGASVQEHLQRLNETLGTILDPESMLCREYQFQSKTKDQFIRPISPLLRLT